MGKLFERRWARTTAECLASVIISILLSGWLLRLEHASLHVPFADGGDALLNSALVKGLVDNGWVWRNPFLGAPFGTQFFDFPFYDNLNLAIMKTIALFSSNYVVVLNVFFLLTFPLTALSALLALRSFRVSFSSSLVVSLLYTFLPFHFQRGEGHLFLSAYFLIPPIAMVILQVWIGGSWTRRRSATAIAICLMVGSATFYYAFFSCYLLCAAGLLSAVSARSFIPAIKGLTLTMVIVTALAINLSPNWLYSIRHGRNPEVGHRVPVESEIYALKMTHLLLPVSGHRIGFMRRARGKYDQATPAYEGTTASLGTIGDLGFLFMVVLLFSSAGVTDKPRLYGGLAVLTMASVLLGTTGGLGAIFNFLIYPQIRAYNRISIFIAFFCLFAIGLLLDSMRQWIITCKTTQYGWYAALVVVLWLGILDQFPRTSPDYLTMKAHYENERAFIAQLEGSLPMGAMVFQLPNTRFPEVPPVLDKPVYDELRGYLHSRTLRWSSGAMRGRPQALWGEQIGSQIDLLHADSGGRRNLSFKPRSLQEVLDALVLAGFSGIYIDRHGLQDGGNNIVTRLQALLDTAPIENGDRHLAFFNLTRYAQRLRASTTPELWEAARRTALEVPSGQDPQ